MNRLRTLLDTGRPLIMGVLNVTPDSFSDGGRFNAPAMARERAAAMMAEGADIIDIGGESTRPGADAVSLDEERARVLPLIESLVGEVDVPLSIDTSKPEIMAEAVAAGAELINDVRALAAPGALETVAELAVPVCLMHMQGEPRTMQRDPYYDDVVAEVGDYLSARIRACEGADIDRERILVDPGFGFGKNLEHNLALLAHLDQLVARLGRPLLAGMSRKRMIGTLLDDAPVEGRLHGSVAAAMIAIQKGARLVRVHDVGPTRQALTILTAVQEAETAT